MHLEAYFAMRKMLDHIKGISGHPRRVYEIGSREVMNGGVKHFFKNYEIYHGIDLIQGEGVDVVGDAKFYEPPFSPDCIVCCEVLEHCPEPEKLIKKCYEVLDSNGWALFTFAGALRKPHSANGGMIQDGEYYRGISPEEGWQLFTDAGFGQVDVATSRPLPPNTHFILQYPPEIEQMVKEQVAGLDTFVVARKV